MNNKIGVLKPVDLRDVWEHEAKDFTNWLSENLDLLSEALDLQLETIEVEKKVDDSRYTIDILAEDENETKVIIENQLEKTDHTHLGQIITYATNLEVSTVVWITKEARIEHQKAVNWLNEFGDIKFYLVEVAAYKIDASDPAPFFSIICKPSAESKMIGKVKKNFEIEKEARRLRRNLADTIIVPARIEGFERVFLGENSWYSIRIKESRLDQIKYIAAYQVAPESAITYVAEVKDIVVSHEDPDKYKVIFKGPAKKIKPIPLGKVSKIQGPAYCEYDKLKTAKDVDDLLAPSADEKSESEAA